MGVASTDGGLARRAALHAALGDRGRLAVVDTLAWGEASPSELATRLGMATNLLAHHLNVLEDVGLVARQRSEGDRRRNYVTLIRDKLDVLILSPAGTPLTAERVVFVCTHNSARSQLAAAMWNTTSRVLATSAGTHPAPRIHPGTVAVARRRHLSLVPAPPRHLRDVLDPADMIVTVCDSAHEELTARHHHSTAAGALHWSIPDPVRVDHPAAFDRVVDELTERITRLAPAVRASSHPAPTDVQHEHRRT